MVEHSPAEEPLDSGLPELLSAIAGTGFLATLPTDLASEIIRSAQLVHYPRGTARGPTSDGPWAAVVVTGVLRQYLPARDGRQVTIRYIRAGDLVGSPDTGSNWLKPQIEAVEPSALLHLDTTRIERVARHRPELSRALNDELTSHLVQVYGALASTAFTTVRSRVARDLLERARAQRPRTGAKVRVTQQALADATGSVREVVARALRDLRLRGLVETSPSGVTILSVDGLIAEAGNVY